jgi:hypothetical protein
MVFAPLYGKRAEGQSTWQRRMLVTGVLRRLACREHLSVGFSAETRHRSAYYRLSSLDLALGINADS